MASKNNNPSEKEELPEIPTEPKQNEKAKKLLAAPDEVIAMALRDLMNKDREE
ncbi:hypothetical protein [Butyrivibrio sp. NC2002]|uniref:hypothetical protein n=1 Tax=Butyrivibrio sp. NC2002 TaxID=1410610 RepID=UPI000B2DDE5A|nr:hypothetical protein [Butyrivibrio sp. NC2002]